MNEKTLVCGMVKFPPSLIAICDTEEVARSMGVRLQPCSTHDIVHHRIACQLLAVYVTEETLDQAIEELQLFLDSVHTGRIDILLVCPLSFSRDLLDAWMLGVHSVVPVSDRLDNLYCAVSRIAALRREMESMSSQLKEASDIALLSMSASSQLGEVVRFMEKSYQCDTAEQLVNLLTETLDTMGLASCGVIQIGHEAQYFGDADKRPYLERLLKEQRGRGRFVDVENRTTLNFECVSVMARNLPEPGSEPYGRMKDVLFSLVEGVDVRVKAIAATRAAMMMEKAKIDFLSVMSHELRTPMNSLLGFSQRLKSKKIGDTFSSRDVSGLEFIANSAERLMDMLDKMYELSRLDVDAERARQRLLVSDVLAGPVKKYQALASAKQLEFCLHTTDTSLIAEVDPRRLTRVISELLDNAVKFTVEGKIELFVEVAWQADQREWLELRVKDTGPGIAPARLQQLFAPLGNVDEFMSRGSSGAQLGLALSNKMVNDVNGVLEVSSEVGKGTTMTVRLPRFVAVPEEASTGVDLF